MSRPLTSLGLYDKANRFLYKNPTVGECFFCTKAVVVYPIGAMSDKYKACKVCIKLRGASKLRLGADEALSALSATAGKNRHCRACERPVYDGSFLCPYCVDDLQRRHGKPIAVNKGRA